MIDLKSEMRAAYAALDFHHGDAILPRTQWLDLANRGLLGIVHGTTDHSDRWQPAEDGKRMVAVPVQNSDAPQFTDIIAFRPDMPERWYLRTGKGLFLGQSLLERSKLAWPGDVPPLVVATPLDWLRANGRAICAVDPGPVAWAELRGLSAITVTSPRFAQVLRLQMSKPPRLPEIHVAEGQRRAA